MELRGEQRLSVEAPAEDSDRVQDKARTYLCENLQGKASVHF